MVDFARVQKELQECNRDFEVSGIRVVPKGEANLAHLLGTIPGPLGTPYEGGTFKIDITLPGQVKAFVFWGLKLKACGFVKMQSGVSLRRLI
ncbi:UNVERIFIED_CONTAM: Ubiquitin-conjugating enzyme E2 27 [Sesamum angustifolium]|uniref:Ubiquitin-conjugating enzyme E2 27 n=1 Tax=Sesamum angustifolium TaxID=2727405 RepID=A0AAW2RJJ6_9LAMI